MQDDHVDQVLSQWAEQRPDLDCSPMGIIGRLMRANRIIEKRLETIFRKFDMSAIEFDILATLRRKNMALTPTELYQTLMLSSGAMSIRLENLVRKNLIERTANNQDRRSNTVRLTMEGKALIDRALEAHVDNEHNILNCFNKEEQAHLASLLKVWLIQNES